MISPTPGAALNGLARRIEQPSAGHCRIIKLAFALAFGGTLGCQSRVSMFCNSLHVPGLSSFAGRALGSIGLMVGSSSRIFCESFVDVGLILAASGSKKQHKINVG